MKLSYGVFHEGYKIAGPIRPAKDIQNAPKSIHLTMGRSDFMPFTVLLSVSSEYSVQLGKCAWFTERGDVPTVRLSMDFPLPVKAFHEQTHIDHRSQIAYADALLPADVKEYGYNQVAGVCYIIETDKKTEPGTYTGKVRLYTSCGMEPEVLAGEIDITLDVLDVTLRSGQENRFYLDLWQHPSNIARHADVRLFSDEHFAVLEEYLRSLSALGQRALTLIVSEGPWGGQMCWEHPESGNNIYEFSMIPVTKRRDGSFSYDFSIMQRYIDLGKKCGIRDELSVYGLINIWPRYGYLWTLRGEAVKPRVRYLNEVTGCYAFMETEQELDDYVRAIEQYFITTGQIDRVRVAADEPADVETFRKSLTHLHEVAPAFTFKAAINHVEFIDEFSGNFSDFVPFLECARDKLKQLQEYKRTMPDKRFLWYTCMGPDRPNYFLSSELVESYLVGILTSVYGLDGYLRWSYTVWTKDPMENVAYSHFPAGDMYIVYPGANGKPILSLRYYALKRGIQFYELLRSYQSRYGKRRMMELVAPLFTEKNIQKYDTSFSTEYADYEALRNKLLKALEKQ